MIDKWHMRFLQMAKDTSAWSRDPSTKCGAVIVRPDKTVASLGFNGFPIRMPDSYRLYEDREEKYSRIIHCEMNALILCREQVKGYTLYTWPFACCDRCVVCMIQAGINFFVFPELAEDASRRWGPAVAKTKRYLNECGIDRLEVKF